MIKKQILPNNQSDLDFFKRSAIEKIYQGKPLTGKNGLMAFSVLLLSISSIGSFK